MEEQSRSDREEEQQYYEKVCESCFCKCSHGAASLSYVYTVTGHACMVPPHITDSAWYPHISLTLRGAPTYH